jgi:hypothetical protein
MRDLRFTALPGRLLDRLLETQSEMLKLNALESEMDRCPDCAEDDDEVVYPCAAHIEAWESWGSEWEAEP